MVDPASIGLVLGGAVLLLFGAALSVYGVALLGVIVGGGGGYLLAPTIGGVIGVEGVAAIGAGILVGAVAGVVATYLLLRMAIVSLSFVVGSYLGIVAIAPALEEGTILTVLIGLAIGAGAAALGLFMKRTALVLITTFLGAALASRSITASHLSTASGEFTIEPLLFDPVAPVFGGLFVLGILSQFGLFKLGYVATIARRLPGASVLTDRDEPTPADA